MQTAENEHTLSLRGILLLLRRRVWLIAIVIVLVTGTVVGLSLMRTPTYESSVQILVTHEPPERVGAPTETETGLRELAATMARAVDSRPVAEEVVQQLGLQMSPDALLGQLEAQQVPNTQFVQVVYKDPSPVRAQQVANTVGYVFSEQISEVSINAAPVTATLWESAAVPSEPTTPRPVRDGLLASVLGLILGIGLAFLHENLRGSSRSLEGPEQTSGAQRAKERARQGNT